MKNLKVLYHADDIHNHFLSEWKTDLFKKEHQKSGSFIHKIMERVARYPLFLYTASDHPTSGILVRDKTEYRHFSPWWGGIHDYPIESQGLHDSYCLHELHHKGYMTYLPGISFDVFREKMQRSETYATIASMFEIYFCYPELRAMTFEFEILADRFLQDHNFVTAYKEDSFATREQIYLMLRDAALRPNPDDPLEQQIYVYGRQNEAWANVWSLSYNSVETRMDALQHAIRSGADRQGAMDEFMGWLQSDKITKGSEIPFIEEATAFAAVYKHLA